MYLTKIDTEPWQRECLLEENLFKIFCQSLEVSDFRTATPECTADSRTAATRDFSLTFFAKPKVKFCEQAANIYKIIFIEKLKQ